MSIASDDWRAWLVAAKREAVDRAIRELYAELDAAVIERGPVCNASGRCCKFDSFGHRLYVTGLEIAWFLHAVQEDPSEADDSKSADRGALSLQQLAPGPVAGACRYQVDGLCSTHAIRPLGCRVFFCEAGTEDWQQDTYERFMEQLKAVHRTHELPYAYVEWRAGLTEADAALAQRDSN